MGIEKKIGRIIARDMRRLAAKSGLNFGPVVLRWRVQSAPAAGADPHLQGSGGTQTFTETTVTINALIHTVNIHTTGYTKFSEVKSGDLILDFVGDAPIDGKSNLRFEVGGISYVQKGTGKELAESWDVRCAGLPVTRSVLVMRGV